MKEKRRRYDGKCVDKIERLRKEGKRESRKRGGAGREREKKVRGKEGEKKRVIEGGGERQDEEMERK